MTPYHLQVSVVEYHWLMVWVDQIMKFMSRKNNFSFFLFIFSIYANIYETVLFLHFFFHIC